MHERVEIATSLVLLAITVLSFNSSFVSLYDTGLDFTVSVPSHLCGEPGSLPLDSRRRFAENIIGHARDADEGIYQMVTRLYFWLIIKEKPGIVRLFYLHVWLFRALYS